MDSSIGVLRNLVVLNLKDCKNLASIPGNIFGMRSLRDLNLSGCPKLFKNPRQSKKLDSSECSSHCQSTTPSILKRTTFRFHSLYPKDIATCLLHSLLRLSCLRKLDISFCGLSQLPDAIGCIQWLEEINLGGNNFVTLPSLMELSKLVYLNLEHCKLLESLPQLPFPTAIEHDHHINTYKTKGLIIFNCPELDEREHCSSIIFSWMIQFIQVNSQSSTLCFDEIIRIVIPKSEIPIWFINQSQGFSIPINLSPVMHDDNNNSIIGIACYAVFSVAPVDPTMTTHAQRPEIAISISNRKTRIRWYDIIPVILERDLIAVKSNHMCLIYYRLELFVDIIKCVEVTLNHLDDFKMKVHTKNGEGLDLNMQNCGYQWVYKQDHASPQKFLSSQVQIHEAQPQPFI